MLGEKAPHILVFAALVAYLGVTKASSYLDDNLFGNRIDRNWSYEVPSVEQIVDFWVKSQIDRREGLGNDYSKEGEVIDDEYLAEPAQVLTDSYEIGKHSQRKVYCVISQGERNCMEVATKHNKNSPVKIRIKSSPKIVTKKIDSEESQTNSAQEFEPSEKQKHYYNINENFKLKYNKDSKNTTFHESGIADYFDVHSKRVLEDPRYQYKLQDSRRRKREVLNEDGSYVEEEEYNEEPDKEYPNSESREHIMENANYEAKSNEALKDYNDKEDNDPNESVEKNEEVEMADKEPEVSYRSKSALFEKDDTPTYTWHRCHLPKKAKNAEILCKKWNSAVACNLYCAYGFRFPEGIMRTTSCKYNEGRWTKQFSECEPFIDCSVRLKAPGTLYCTTNHMKSGAECGISCEKSALNKKFDERKYTCVEEGRWSPQLPPCVESEGLDVLQPPDVTVHKELTYPSKYPQ